MIAKRSLTSPLKDVLVSRVRAVFNDPAKGETPVVRSNHALFQPDSVIWRVHSDVTTMMIGGVTALLVQMLHPAALAGVWDHSQFREDMSGRLRRTARFIAVTTFAEREQADGAIARVRAIHKQVQGVMEDGQPYRADDPWLLAWVHVCETLGFLDAWIAYAEPYMTVSDQDQYVREAGLIAKRLGAHPVPETRAEAELLITRFLPELRVSTRTRTVTELLFTQRPASLSALPAHHLIMTAAVDLMPAWAKALHHLRVAPGLRPLVRASARSVAKTLRWAFQDARRPLTDT